jgi:hypothetical protein
VVRVMVPTRGDGGIFDRISGRLCRHRSPNPAEGQFYAFIIY